MSADTGAGVMCAWWWIRAQRRRRDPLVDVRAAAGSPMRWLHLTSLLVGVMLMVSMIACSRLLQEPAAAGGIGLSALAAALLLTPGGIAMLATPPLVSRLSQVLRAELLPAAGAMIALLGYLGLIVQRDQVWHVCVWATVVCAGVGTAMSATPMLVTERTAPGSMASAQAVHALARFFGTAIASATVGLVVGAPAAPGEFSLIFGVGAGAAAAAIACGVVMGRARPSSAPFTVS